MTDYILNDHVFQVCLQTKLPEDAPGSGRPIFSSQKRDQKRNLLWTPKHKSKYAAHIGAHCPAIVILVHFESVRSGAKLPLSAFSKPIPAHTPTIQYPGSPTRLPPADCSQVSAIGGAFVIEHTTVLRQGAPKVRKWMCLK